MSIPMANSNVAAAGRGVIATQGGTPVLGARGVTVAVAVDTDAFGLTLRAETADVADAAGGPADGEVEAATESSVPEGISLFEDGDAAETRHGRKGGEAASGESSSSEPIAAPAGPAMQAPPLLFNAPWQTRMAPTSAAATDYAVRLGAVADPANHSPLPVLAFLPKGDAGREFAGAGMQDAPAMTAASVAAPSLPAGITLPGGLTLNLQPLLQAAGTNPGLASGNAARNSLVEQLGERLHVQLTNRSEHALIRLDPPSMGRIEILISQEGGNTQVQMRASNPEVARQLHAIGDQLRQDLVQRQHGEVSVHVQDGGRDGEGRGRQRQPQQAAGREEPGRALREEDTEDGEASRFALQS